MYKRFDVGSEEPVQYVGVHPTHWQPEWGQPTVMFREAKDGEVLDAARQISHTLDTIKFAATVYVHSHVDNPGAPYDFGILDVTGKNVSLAMLDCLKQDSRIEIETGLFSGLETEAWHTVTMVAEWYDDHWEFSVDTASEKKKQCMCPDPLRCFCMAGQNASGE